MGLSGLLDLRKQGPCSFVYEVGSEGLLPLGLEGLSLTVGTKCKGG